MIRSTKVLIADDDALIATQLEAMVRALRPEWHVLTSVHDHDALRSTVDTDMPDLLLLDLHMPNPFGDGADSLSVLRSLSYQPSVIVVTGDPTRALAAYDNAVIDYLVKPVAPARLRRALQKVMMDVTEPKRLALPGAALAGGPSDAKAWLSAQRGDDIVIVKPADILYLQADRRNTRVMLPDGEALLRCGISEIERGLSHWYMLRVHRGTIVNLQHVECVRRDELGRLRVHLVGCPDQLVVSRPFEAHFRSGTALA